MNPLHDPTGDQSGSGSLKKPAHPLLIDSPPRGPCRCWRPRHWRRRQVFKTRNARSCQDRDPSEKTAVVERGLDRHDGRSSRLAGALAFAAFRRNVKNKLGLTLLAEKSAMTDADATGSAGQQRQSDHHGHSSKVERAIAALSQRLSRNELASPLGEDLSLSADQGTGAETP